MKYEYNKDEGLIKLYNEKNICLILNNTSYIFINGKKYFINNYIKSEQGILLIPEDVLSIIINNFSNINKKDFNIITENFNNKIHNQNEYFLDSKKVLLNDKNSVNASFDEKELEKNIDDEKIFNKYIYKKDEKPKDIKINAIILDPGHGGSDPGAIGYSGTKEKDVVLKVALILKDKLSKIYSDKKIILTRDKDYFVSLEKRSNIANYVFNKYGASIFISIHVNASRSKKSYGFETWILVEEYRRKIIKKGEVSSYEDVEDILNSLLNNEIYHESKDLSKKISNNLEKKIGYVSENRGIKEQTYFVIKKSIMPAILVEIGFNTNKYEEIRLTKYEYLNKIAEGIFTGIKEFIYEYEKTYGYTK